MAEEGSWLAKGDMGATDRTRQEATCEERNSRENKLRIEEPLADTLSCERRLERRAVRVLDTFCEEEKPVFWRMHLAFYCILPRKHLSRMNADCIVVAREINDDPGSKETALVDKSLARELDFSRPITPPPPPPPPPELTRERARLKERHSARCGAGGTVLSLPDHQADLVPNYKSH
ncbi:hypothetical protein ALC53_08514 [Atta colombica]|uniref:Uncharacterized protein n=1 Tax=Atta colombica TaxID=520822 RepID=A0A195B9G3_9HYME|nr:hypothetical protein ALC53_08514 [Atta colombica]